MAELELINISKAFGTTTVLHTTSLKVAKGEFVTILGPSGCGKSTLLRILMGITAPTTGEIVLSARRIEALPPERRDIAMVFQSYALFPHMTVRNNIAFGLKMKKVPKPDREKRIAAALAICNLTPYENRMPRHLSGGQQQRVALARAIVLRPRLMLFDEPLSNLDAKLRDSLRHDIVALHRQTESTSLYVTHDQAEAMAMSDRIIVMNQGRIVETGTPVELYRAPQHAFTAAFLGQTNLIDVLAEGLIGQLPWGQSTPVSRSAKGRVTVSIRPEAIAIIADDKGPGTITSVTFMGASIAYTVDVAGRPIMVLRNSAEGLLAVGSRVALTIDGAAHVLDSTSTGPALGPIEA